MVPQVVNAKSTSVRMELKDVLRWLMVRND
jgi:hypothetical protein